MTVSNAALRSRRIRMELAPESADSSRSLVTLTRAVSVLCLVLKPDWKGSRRSWSLSCCCSWLETTRSRTLARKGRL